jgi:hypothetical protein
MTNQSQNDSYLCHQCRINNQKLDLFQSSDDESEQNCLVTNSNILPHFNRNDDSIFNLFPAKESNTFCRLLHAPGDIIGHMDLLNGQTHTETCKCVTNTLVRL